MLFPLTIDHIWYECDGYEPVQLVEPGETMELLAAGLPLVPHGTVHPDLFSNRNPHRCMKSYLPKSMVDDHLAIRIWDARE
jgi:hypothetical protein